MEFFETKKHQIFEMFTTKMTLNCFFFLEIFGSISLVNCQVGRGYSFNLRQNDGGSALSHTVDGLEIRQTHQLRLVVYPSICKV